MSGSLRSPCFAAVATLLCGSAAALTGPPPSLGAAASFVVLGGDGVGNAGGTIATGNVGASPRNSVAGFPPGTFVVGDIFRDDTIARQAHADSVAAYADLAARPCDRAPPLDQPGVHCIAAALSGKLVLQGSATDVWVFQVSGPFTVDNDAVVRLSGGAVSSNVFWIVDGPVTLGTRSSFVGTILARGAIAFGRVASISGRAISLSGAVTSDTDDLTLCCDPIDILPEPAQSAPVALSNATAGAAYSATLSADGGTTPYTFALFDGQLPPGLTLGSGGTVSGTPTSSGTFTATARVTDAHHCSGLRTFRINVCSTGPLPAIALPPATLCVPYSPGVAITVSNPPPGLDAALTGTPKQTGDFTFTVTGTDSSGCPFTRPYTLHVGCNAVPAAVLPKATVGHFYGGGVTPFCGLAYELDSGTLPPGISPATISGTPAKPGLYTFTVRAVGSPSCTATYTIEVVCDTLSFSPATLPAGDTCTIYDQTITVTGGLQPYTFAVTAPPASIVATPSGTTVHLAGLPSAASTTTIDVVATDSAGCSQGKSYVLAIAAPSALTILPLTLPPANYLDPYNQKLSVICGTPPVAYAVASGVLPDGLDVCGDTICGTPTAQALSRKFTIGAVDGAQISGSREYTICLPIAIDPPALPDAVAGQQYTATLTARGGAGPFDFSPANVTGWLGLSSGGALTGTPPAPGDYTFTMTAMDRPTGCAGTRTYPLHVRTAQDHPCGVITLSPRSTRLPTANVGILYNQAVVAGGSTLMTPSYTYRVVVMPAQELPPGVMLSATTGAISGIPTKLGHYNFAIVATDGKDVSCPEVYTIEVLP